MIPIFSSWCSSCWIHIFQNLSSIVSNHRHLFFIPISRMVTTKGTVAFRLQAMGVKENRKQLAKRPTFRLKQEISTLMRTCPEANVVFVLWSICVLFAIIIRRGIGMWYLQIDKKREREESNAKTYITLIVDIVFTFTVITGIRMLTTVNIGCLSQRESLDFADRISARIQTICSTLPFKKQ